MRPNDRGWYFHKLISTSEVLRHKYKAIETFCDECVVDTYNRSNTKLGELEKFDFGLFPPENLSVGNIPFTQLYELVYRNNGIKIYKT